MDDATLRLAAVLTGCIAPVGVIPLGVWLHDRTCATLDNLQSLAEGLACAFIFVALHELLTARQDQDSYRGADAD